MNNSGYTIERVLWPDIYDPMNDVAPWKYGDLPTLFCARPDTFMSVVRTVEELDEALRQCELAWDERRLSWIEVVVDRFDAHGMLKGLHEAVFKRPYLPPAPGT